MLKNDILLAQNIVGLNKNNVTKDNYHNTSFIYKTSNEEINNYQKYLKDKSKILAITASGDQILNSILEGTSQVDSCDISRFPQYFFELKRAAVLSLRKEDYLKFFINTFNYEDEFSDDIYDSVRSNLEKDSLKFWDSLFQFYEGFEIYHSPLFSRELLIESGVVSKNKYLQDDNYNLLKNKISSVSINHFVGNINEEISNMGKDYDLANLSSIIYYGDNVKADNYKKLLHDISLNDNGTILTYLYKVRDDIKKIYCEDEYSFEKFPNSIEGVMVYSKKMQ